MKKARIVEIPSDRPLTTEEYEDFNSHALNSSIWYASTGGKNTYQIKKKLVTKGYSDDDVTIKDDSGLETYENMIANAVERVLELHLVDDEGFVRNAVNAAIRSGKSMSSVRTKMTMTGLPRDFVNSVIEQALLDEDDDVEKEALHRAASKVVTSSAYRKLEGQKAKQKIVMTLVTKGFNMGEVYEWINEHLERD